LEIRINELTTNLSNLKQKLGALETELSFLRKSQQAKKIIILGRAGSGKSTLGNLIAGK